MKPKNVMLLGFVNKAVDYLDKHIDQDVDSRLLKELRNIDLDSLKDELSNNIGASLGTMQSTVNTLLHAGEEAFDDFMNYQKNQKGLTAKLNRVFNGEYFDKNRNLDSLLKYYSLNKNLDLEEDLEVFEGKKVNQNVSGKVGKNTSFKESDNTYVYDENIDTDQQEETPFEMSEEDDRLMARIVANVNKVKNGEDLYYSYKNNHSADDDSLDNIFSEVVAQEGNPHKAYQSKSMNKKPKQGSRIEQPDKDDIIKMVQDLQTSRELYFPYVKDGFVPVDRIDQKESMISAEFDKQTEKQQTQGYVSGLIDDLRAKMVKEDQRKAYVEKEYREVYDRIHTAYPYLTSSFIRSVFELKDSFAQEYPVGVKIIVLHRCVFKDVENLRQFVEIALNHDYSINADEHQLIVDVFREYTNTDGKIITSIYEVANQSAILNGAYDGYRVMYAERV